MKSRVKRIVRKTCKMRNDSQVQKQIRSTERFHYENKNNTTKNNTAEKYIILYLLFFYCFVRIKTSLQSYQIYIKFAFHN